MNRDERPLIRFIYRIVCDARWLTVCFIHTLQIFWQIWGPDIIKRSISFWCHNLCSPGFGDILPFFSADPLNPCRFGWGSGSGRGTFTEMLLRPSCTVSALCSGSFGCFFFKLFFKSLVVLQVWRGSVWPPGGSDWWDPAVMVDLLQLYSVFCLNQVLVRWSDLGGVTVISSILKMMESKVLFGNLSAVKCSNAPSREGQVQRLQWMESKVFYTLVFFLLIAWFHVWLLAHCSF